MNAPDARADDEYAALERNKCEHGCWPTEICEDCQDNGHRFHAVAGCACSIDCGWCGWCWRDEKRGYDPETGVGAPYES